MRKREWVKMLAIDWRAFGLGLLFLALLYFLYQKFKGFPKPALYFSNLGAILGKERSLRSRFGNFPLYLNYVSLALFWLAFIDPHWLIQGASSNLKQDPKEGIAIYLILDQSKSMGEPVSGQNIPKIDLLKEVTSAFVKERPNDMIGMVGFARSAQVIDPLTLDHQAILNSLKEFSVQQAKNQEGTALGYAIYKTANLIAATKKFAKEEGASYDIKSAIMVLVTDGVQEINPLDKDTALRPMNIPDAALYAKQNGVRLYIVNIEPLLATPEFEPHVHQMTTAAASTGGKFYLMAGGVNLSEIFSDIDQLEKSKLPEQPLNPDQKQYYERKSLYPYLIGLGLLAFFIAQLLKTTLLRKVP